ncbi:uncharacterized protein HMPREF1541_06544 [Cyphellophora europaea CBS 101466]|uniref:Integral membrane protein n=1 Tax=Cyphellophora europaea (strain CBS 101466) TaxID=1220924 RepID=W2RS24_CYPE1|nr:uncharacterized protein HMPREF1541_06544 [Cyphellophora europaea CBS 101466]ETN38509.1 hypothetical protein HMPREF1541_06544 [Cyphellophora europaea CBS 101466]
MVQAGRVACITAPFLLSIAALVTLVLVFIAGTMEENRTTGDLYFVKIDLTNLTLSASSNIAPDADATTLSTLGNALEAAKQTLGMDDHYTVYLRNYCSWNADEDAYSDCISPKAYFWFNPIKVWGLDRAALPVEDYLPGSFRNGLDAYHSGSKAMFVLYAAALASTCFSILVGITAIFSRWGSFFTTFFATVAWVAYAAATIVATAMFAILKGVIDNELEDDYGVETRLGTRALATSWIGTAFAVGAGFFWFLSVCCCSGRSPYNKNHERGRGKTRAEKTPYTYERVGSPYMGPSAGQSVPLGAYGGAQPQQTGSAYEPFRSRV